MLDECGDARPEAADRLGYDGAAASDRAGAAGGAEAGARQPDRQRGEIWRQRAGARWRTPQPGTDRASTIEDDGPGIPPDELERVFEPFHRVETSRNRETGGTGLGLPIARNILRAHGGDVTLANRAAGRAAGAVTLPV